MHLAAHLVLWQPLQRDEVDLLEQHPVDTNARVAHFVATLGRCGLRLWRDGLRVVGMTTACWVTGAVSGALSGRASRFCRVEKRLVIRPSS